jgi:FixJ family two-component response regulator
MIAIAQRSEALTMPADPQKSLRSLTSEVTLREPAQDPQPSCAFEEIQSRYASLTYREKQVLYFVTRGLMNKQAAGILGLSVITVKIHRAKMMRKMNCRRFVDIIRIADRLGVSSFAGADAPDFPA